jgi:hypothetical protein
MRHRHRRTLALVAAASLGVVGAALWQAGASAPRTGRVAPAPTGELPWQTASDTPTQTATPAAPARVSSAQKDDEANLMARLRLLDGLDPARALQLASEGNARFPDGLEAAERAEIVVKSLALGGRLSEARAGAEAMVNRYAGTPWAREVELHTGAHPHINH